MSLKTKIMQLPFAKKLLTAGAFLLALSVFLPWYSDMDIHKTGSTYLGITGPLYLAGIIVLAMAGLSIFLAVSEILGTKTPRLPVSKNKIYLYAICVSAFMLVLSASVYFHAKFGINIRNKSLGAGYILAILSLVTMTVGQIFETKTREQIDSVSNKHKLAMESMGLSDRPSGERQSSPSRLKIPISDGSQKAHTENEKSAFKVPSSDTSIENERFSYYSGSSINQNSNPNQNAENFNQTR